MTEPDMPSFQAIESRAFRAEPRRTGEDSTTLLGAVDPRAETVRLQRQRAMRNAYPAIERRPADADMIVIPDRDGTAGVFDKNTGRRLGTIDEDGVPIDPLVAPAWSTANAILFGAFAGFVLAASISLLAFRYWIPLH